MTSFRQVKIAREQADKALWEFLKASALLNYPGSWPTGRGIPYRRIPAVLHRQFKNAVDEILSAVAKRTSPSEEAFEVLRVALNDFEVARISYPFRIEMHPMRRAAENLLEYLRLTKVCGPLHTGCKLEGCNKIVHGGRGNKRFCSNEHRKEFWTYSRQRKYFQEKQKANREIRARNKSKESRKQA